MHKLKICWPHTGPILFKGGKGIIGDWADEMERQGWEIEHDHNKWADCDLVFFCSDSQLFPEPLLKKPCILYFWGWMPARMIDRNFQQIARKQLEMMAKCNRILTPGLVTMDQTADFGLPNYLCLPGVNSRVFDMAEDAEREPQVMFLSRIAPHKHLDALIDAVSHIEPKLKLLVCGPGDNRPFKEMADRLGVNAEFVELDEKEKATELKRSTVLVHPSSYEGFGLPPLEALYHGTPVIAFDIPQLRWLLKEHAYFFSSVEGLAKAIMHVFEHPEEAQGKASTGKEMVGNVLTLEKACGRLGQHISEVLKEDMARRMQAGEDPGDIYDLEARRNWQLGQPSQFNLNWSRHWRAKEMLSVLEKCKAKKILDVGSGPVYPSIFAAHGFEVTALDISREVLEQASELARRNNVKIDSQQGDAANLEYPDDSYDAVILGEILEHVTHPTVVIKEAMRVLKPGGYLIASTPIGEHHDDALHMHHWTDESINELLKPWETDIVSVKKIAESDYMQAFDTDGLRQTKQVTEPSCYLIVLGKK